VGWNATTNADQGGRGELGKLQEEVPRKVFSG